MSLKNPVSLSQINQKELLTVQDIVSSHQLISKKLGDYANQCQDAQLKQIFQQASQEASMTAQNLIQSL